MDTHNMCFHGELKKISILFDRKKKTERTLYLKLQYKREDLLY